MSKVDAGETIRSASDFALVWMVAGAGYFCRLFVVPDHPSPLPSTIQGWGRFVLAAMALVVGISAQEHFRKSNRAGRIKNLARRLIVAFLLGLGSLRLGGG